MNKQEFIVNAIENGWTVKKLPRLINSYEFTKKYNDKNEYIVKNNKKNSRSLSFPFSKCELIKTIEI